MIPVLCLPHAGAGASFFWSWRKLVAPEVSLVPLQLPGREERVDEQPYTDVHEAVAALAPEAVRAAGTTGPVALFGHSLGAILAFELARSLEQQGIVVRQLLASGSPGPWVGRSRRATGIDDDQFLARVEDLAGYRHPAFDVPELRELILPTLRADVEMHEAYQPRSTVPLTAPITCVRGDSDSLVPPEDALAWNVATSGGFDLVQVPGGHMYLTDSSAKVVDLICTTVAPTSRRL